MKFSCNSIVLSFELPPFASFLMGHTVADVVDALESGDDLFVMGDDDDGGLELPSHVVEDANHRHGTHAVERCGGFIRQDHRWAVNQSARDGNPLLLATGELRWHGVNSVLHIKRRKQFQCLRSRLCIRDACKHRQQGHVVGDIEKRNQVRRLEDKTNFVAPQWKRKVEEVVNEKAETL